MMPHPTFFAAAIAASTLALTSCGTADEEPDPAASTPEQSPSAQEPASGVAGEDDAGNSHENPEAETPAPESDPEPSEDGALSGDDDADPDEEAEEGDEPQPEPEPEAFNPEEFSLEGVQQEVEPGDIADLGDFTAVRHGFHDDPAQIIIDVATP
ncbi:hypothetical protein [Nesterenkonia jeotgali]|uniref:AMIN domain-containing protein n=1 Tax=Nesterenkonia jeotgali TaxID=317018 RepID=A0A839FW17_9MICC|nr:hypothetical protein [Nesterenkonia jeotgali]MBA8920967.1 hypothetical protein [Nesterenkonia jeotgali]